MKKTKILHLTTSLKTGGAETVLVDLIRNIDTNQFDNYVIYFYEGPNVEKLKNLGIKTYQIKGLFCKYDPIFLFRLFIKIKKIKPDCIHSLLWSANILGTIFAKILRIPIACAMHLATNFESVGKNGLFRTKLDNMVLPKSDAIIAVSDSMVFDLKAKNSWLEQSKLKIIKNGIDIETINKQKSKSEHTRERYNIAQDAFVIGNVGRFIPRKNQMMLIDSFAMLAKDYNDVCLILVGYGHTEELLRSRVQELGIGDKVKFIRTDNAYQYYQFFDCFVLTSLNESFGLVTLEAMLFGLPCIVTNEGKIHEIITDNENGYLINNNDVISLYLKLKMLRDNRQERDRIGINAKQAVCKNFDIKNMVKNYENLFKELI